MATGVAPLDPDTILQESGAWLEGDFLLASGSRSTFYFDSKPFTLNPKYAEFVGKYFFDKLKDSVAVAVGGMALGAIPLVAHIVLISQREGRPLPGFYVRQEPKTHGTLKLIEGNLPKDTTQPVAIIDDIVTGGGSILKAIDAVEGAGNPIVRVMCILDRNEGGREALRERSY
ncbi:MAG: orotate phosphoribosyltransferase, partial [Chloroflexi bacterium]|nr:orotate phosphoribosyltransferase [Chloroflexota bacterium]